MSEGTVIEPTGVARWVSAGIPQRIDQAQPVPRFPRASQGPRLNGTPRSQRMLRRRARHRPGGFGRCWCRECHGRCDQAWKTHPASSVHALACCNRRAASGSRAACCLRPERCVSKSDACACDTVNEPAGMTFRSRLFCRGRDSSSAVLGIGSGDQPQQSPSAQVLPAPQSGDVIAFTTSDVGIGV